MDNTIDIVLSEAKKALNLHKRYTLLADKYLSLMAHDSKAFAKYRLYQAKAHESIGANDALLKLANKLVKVH